MSLFPRMCVRGSTGQCFDAYSCKGQPGVAPSGKSLPACRGWGRMCLQMCCAAHGRAMWSRCRRLPRAATCRRANSGSQGTARRGLWRRQLPHSKQPLSSSCRPCRAKALRGHRQQVGGSSVSCGRLICKALELCRHMLSHTLPVALSAKSSVATRIKQRRRFVVRAVMRPDVATRACEMLYLQCPYTGKRCLSPV